MYCKDLKVVNLTITEDFYEYKGIFQLCSGKKRVEIDLAEFNTNTERINEIRDLFGLQESVEEIYETIMDKVMDATKIHSRVIEKYQKYIS
jgi:hypothetical protein